MARKKFSEDGMFEMLSEVNRAIKSKSYIKYDDDTSRYSKFLKTLPDNLRNTDIKNYNLYGMWEAAGKPSSFEDVQDTEFFPLQEDGTYHGFSVGNDGMFLKSKTHPSAWQEYMVSQLNPELYNNYNVRVNPEGYFGENQLQYQPNTLKEGTNLPIIEDAGSFNEENVWIPDWEAITEQAKKLGAKTVKTKSGVIINFDKNWQIKNVDDNPNYLLKKFVDGGTPTEPVWDPKTNSYILPEVEVTAEAPDWYKNKQDIESDYSKDWYINNILPKWSRAMGVSSDNMGGNMKGYDEYVNDKLAEKILAKYPDLEENKRAILESLSPKELEIIKNSNLAYKIEPSIWQKFEQGLLSVGNSASPVEFKNENLTAEQAFEQDNPLNILQPLRIPAKAVQSAFRDNYSFSDAMSGRENNADLMEELATDPLILSGFGIGRGALGKVSNISKFLTEETALKNASKFNPWAFKPNKTKWYRQVEKDAIDNALFENMIKSKDEVITPEAYDKFLKTQPGEKINAPYFSKGKVYWPDHPTNNYLIETGLPDENFAKSYMWHLEEGTGPTNLGTAVLKPDPSIRNLENFKLYKKDWLRGYKPIEMPNANSFASIENPNKFDVFDLNIVRKPSGSIGNQGATPEGARDILKSIGIDVKGTNANQPTFKEMVEHLKNNPKDAEKFQKFLEKEPISISELPGGEYKINDGHHRATLSYYSGNEKIPAIIKNKGEYTTPFQSSIQANKTVVKTLEEQMKEVNKLDFENRSVVTPEQFAEEINDIINSGAQARWIEDDEKILKILQENPGIKIKERVIEVPGSRVNPNNAESVAKEIEFNKTFDEGTQFAHDWVLKDTDKARKLSQKIDDLENADWTKTMRLEDKKTYDAISKETNSIVENESLSDEIKNAQIEKYMDVLDGLQSKYQVANQEKISKLEDELYSLVRPEYVERLQNVYRLKDPKLGNPSQMELNVVKGVKQMFKAPKSTLVSYGSDDAALKSLSEATRRSIAEDPYSMLGVKTSDANITFKELPAKPEYAYVRDPKTGEQYLVKAIELNPASAADAAGVNVHETGHVHQDVFGFKPMLSKYNPDLGYYSNQDTPFGSRFGSFMTKPKPKPSGKDYDYATWLSDASELHSESMKSRFNMYKKLKKDLGYTHDEAMYVLQNPDDQMLFELLFNPELKGNPYKHFEARGLQLDKGLASENVNVNAGTNTTYPINIMKEVLKNYMPAFIGTGVGGAGLKSIMNSESEPFSKKVQKFGGNISNLEKFIK